MKRCQLLEKCKSKVQWGTTSHQSEWPSLESLQISNAGEGMEKREPSYTTGRNVRWGSHFGKQYGGSSGEGNGTPLHQALAWKIPWTEEPGRPQSMGLLRVRHNWATSLSLFHLHALEKEMATHSSILAWRIPGTGEPGGLLSMGSHRVGHDWSDLAAAAAALGKMGKAIRDLYYFSW